MVAATGLAVALAGPASAAAPAAVGPGARSAHPTAAASTSAPMSHALLFAHLRGSEERPGPGDPDGMGMTAMLLLPDSGRVCYLLRVDGLDPVLAGHIHRGQAGQPGPVVVNLQLEPGTRRNRANCVDGDPAILRAIAAAPSDYYVNVHTTAFPAGAIRGQLRSLHEG